MAAFSVLPTDYLATQPGSSEMTLQNLIDTQDRLAEEAREVLPYSFDECTYSKGYLRQSVWSCLGALSDLAY
jgi:E3 ubiquitin-protein ligase UBR7